MACAPVNAPFSWPNSSLSSSASGMAPQLMATNGASRGRLRRCRARATISLPVPFSPRISTGALVLATLRTNAKTACIGGLAAEHLLERLGARLVLHGAVLTFELRHVHASLQHELEFVGVHRLDEEVVGPGADGAQRVLLVALARDDDDLGLPVEHQQPGERGETFLRVVGRRRQPEVEQGDQRTFGREGRDRRRAVAGHGHVVVARERPLHLHTDVLVVVDDEQPGFRHLASSTSAAGRLTRTVVPAPTSLSTWMLPPWASTTIRDWNIPMPSPFDLVLWNGLNSESRRNAGLMPQPVSAHREHHALAAVVGAHVDAAGGTQGIARVEEQVGHHAQDLLPVGQDGGNRREVVRDLHLGLAVERADGLLHDLVQVGLDAHEVGPLPQGAQPGDHVVDAAHGVADAAQRVGPELRVVEVHRQVLQRQVQRRRRVLQVVHEERRHRAERLEFPAAGDLVGQRRFTSADAIWSAMHCSSSSSSVV